MKAKLVKKYGEFMLLKDNIIIASSDKNFNGDLYLSLSNCQAIERVYDLDELAHIRAEILNSYTSGTKWADEIDKLLTRYREVIELMGDKKYSEEDLKRVFIEGSNWTKDESLEQDTTFGQAMSKSIQSLQQTQWDVEIEMWFHGTRHKKGEWIPKLDADGCLILKID